MPSSATNHRWSVAPTAASLCSRMGEGVDNFRGVSLALVFHTGFHHHHLDPHPSSQICIRDPSNSTLTIFFSNNHSLRRSRWTGQHGWTFQIPTNPHSSSTIGSPPTVSHRERGTRGWSEIPSDGSASGAKQEKEQKLMLGVCDDEGKIKRRSRINNYLLRWSSTLLLRNSRIG